MPSRENTLSELQSIFPQHEVHTVQFIYDDVLSLFGDNPESEHLILPSCIERLLELPDDYAAPVPQLTNVYQELNEKFVVREDVPTIVNFDNVFRDDVEGSTNNNNNSNKNNEYNQNNTKNTASNNRAFSETDSFSANSSSSSDSLDSLNEFIFDEYRQKQRPTYRDQPLSSPLSSNVSSIGSDFNLGDDVLLLDEISTPQDKVRHRVVEAPDDLIIVNHTKGPSTTTPTSLTKKDITTPSTQDFRGRKRKSNEPSPSGSSAKKNKTPSKTEGTSNSVTSTPLVGSSSSTISTTPIPQNNNSSTPRVTTPAFLTKKDVTTPSTQDFRGRKRKSNEPSPSGSSAKKIKTPSKTEGASNSVTSTHLAGSSSSTISTTPIPQNNNSSTPRVGNQLREPTGVEHLNTLLQQSLDRFQNQLYRQSKQNTPPVKPSLPAGKTQVPPAVPSLPPPPVPKVVEVDYSKLRYGVSELFDKHALSKIKNVIHDVTEGHLKSLLRNIEYGATMDDTVSRIVTSLLDDKTYPKEPKIKKSIISTSTTTSEYSTYTYRQQAVAELQKKFPKVSTKVFKSVLSAQEYSYTRAYREIRDSLVKITNGKAKVENTVIGAFLKGRRNSTPIKTREPVLVKELYELEDEERKSIEEQDRKTAMAINNLQYEEDGQSIECGCCYIESPFDTMVQCYEGHLFCPECLRSYSKEAAFGSGKTHLQCMTDGCEAAFPFSQLQKALPEKILNKFLEREQDESLKLANLQNLFKCPYCEFAAVVGGNDKVFSCQNPSCMKETCMHCKEPWDDNHFGVPCKEMEKKDITNLRTSYEEKMTQAKVRKCWQCSTIFLKSSGCNKMTCRCGAKMCYICRKPKIDYTHFCQHLREPGQSCKKCTSCSLWTDPEEDDNRAIAEIQKEAEVEREKLAGEDSKEETRSHIGPTIELAAIKPQQPVYIQQPAYIQHQQEQQNRQRFAGGGGGGGNRRRNGRGRGGNHNNDWVDLVLNMQAQ